MRARTLAVVLAGLILAPVQTAQAGQAPGAASAPNIPISGRDRVYLSDQTSNTVSVVNPEANSLLGVIRLGEPTPGNLSPLYTGQLLVRGENYVQVLDGQTYVPKLRIIVPNGPGMTIFSPDGKYGYVCSSFSPETVVVDVHSHRIVGRVPQASPFCPDIAATPDGQQVWFTLKDIGRTEVFDARPPFNKIALLDTGPITNHVNIVRNARGQFAYVTVGGLSEVKVFTTSDEPQLVATIQTGALPHGLWPSGDGTRIYVGLENANAVAAIDTGTNKVIATISSGQSPQGMVYVPDAVPSGSGKENLSSLGASGQAVYLTLGVPGSAKELTTVAVNNQGLVDLLEAAVTGLEPKSEYVLALAENPDGSGALEPIAQFKTNPRGAAIVTTIGPLRRVVQRDVHESRRYLVIAQTVDGKPAIPVQVQRQ
jgi:YVTN family beta-propeller protein